MVIFHSYVKLPEGNQGLNESTHGWAPVSGDYRQETMPYILGGDRVQLPGKSHVDIQVGLDRGKKNGSQIMALLRIVMGKQM
jgi:hypothetical protein